MNMLKKSVLTCSRTLLRILPRTLLLLLPLMLVQCTLPVKDMSVTALDREVVMQSEILNLRAMPGAVFASGQPSEEQLMALGEAGVVHVISLRSDGEIDWDERAVVEAAGMTYHGIPVAGAAGVNRANAESLDRLLASLAGEPVLVHCGSANRVGALVALAQADVHGQSVEDAVARGIEWGMTGLEPVVREKLSASDSPSPSTSAE